MKKELPKLNTKMAGTGTSHDWCAGCIHRDGMEDNNKPDDGVERPVVGLRALFRKADRSVADRYLARGTSGTRGFLVRP